jgi:hypothetical protein
MLFSSRTTDRSHPIYQEYPSLDKYPPSCQCSDTERLEALIKYPDCFLQQETGQEYDNLVVYSGDCTEGRRIQDILRLDPRNALDDLVARAKRHRWD